MRTVEAVYCQPIHFPNNHPIIQCICTMIEKHNLWFSCILIVCYIHLPSFLLAQSPEKKNSFDSAYYHIASSLSAKDINQAIIEAESLLRASADSIQKVRSFMLLATLFERTGKHTEALNYAVQAEKLAEKINNKEWQIRISGFLSTTFRDLGLVAEGKKYITIAENANDGASRSSLINVFIHQEKAYYAIEEKNYHTALAETRKAIKFFESIPENKANRSIIATSYQVAGFCYMNLDSFSLANQYLSESLEKLGDQESVLKGFIYQNWGELALKQKRFPDAIRYLGIALDYAISSDNFNLKGNTYKSLRDYYLSQGDSTNGIRFQSDYTDLVEARSFLTKNISNELIKKFGYELERKATRNYVLYIVCGVLLVLTAFSTIYFRLVQKRDRVKYQSYIEKFKAKKLNDLVRKPVALNEKTALSAAPAGLQEERYGVGDYIIEEDNKTGIPLKQEAVPENEKKEGFSIPHETEERILRDLLLLEQEQFYLNNDINLSYLSATLKINSKYLSMIINKHKGKDFNNYINVLRINHIIDRLQNNKDYLEYKIAYLARECGFSTHSKFTAAFRQLTGIAPSAFISNLKKDNC